MSVEGMVPSNRTVSATPSPLLQLVDLLGSAARDHQHRRRVAELDHRLQQELHALVGLEGPRVEDDLRPVRHPRRADVRRQGRVRIGLE
jgi:hypothetical protein